MMSVAFTWGFAILAAFFFAAWAAMKFARAGFRFITRRWLNLGSFARAVVLAIVLVTGVMAQKATNSVPGPLFSPPIARLASPAPAPSVTPDEIACGYRLVGVETNAECSYAMSEGACLKHGWWVHGAYDDCFDLDFGDWRFPLGTDDLASACIFTWGKMRPERKDRARELNSVGGGRCAAVPYCSRFWSGLSPSNTMLLTWENFAMNRDTNMPVNAQIELWPCGDFVMRSNAEARVFRRVEPFDWDGDGIPNGIDARPFVSDGDCHGSSNELPQGNASNQYYFVDLVVDDAAAEVEFFGDGPSDYPDPHFVARAGETNRVMLLIGKGYWVESSRPIRCVGTSDARVEVWQDTSDALSICWPVSIDCVEAGESGGLLMAPQHTPNSSFLTPNSFTMSVTPDWLGGVFEWDTNCCCGVTGGVGGYWFACPIDRDCGCHGCTVSGVYTYAGYSIDVWGGRCGCEQRREAGATVRFSPHAIIYEEAYTNAPGEIVGRRSTAATLSVDAYGGVYGGTVKISLEGGGHLSGDLSAFPINRELAAGESLSCVFAYTENSASQLENDVVVRTVFTDAFTGAARTNETALTVVRVELRECVDPPMEGSLNRHYYGVRELVELIHFPLDVNLMWTCAPGGGVTSHLSNPQRKIFECPIVGAECPLRASYSDCEYVPEVCVIEPSGVVARNATYCKYAVPTNSAGGIGMSFDLFVLPLNVSFSRVAVEEVPCELGVKSGYFQNSCFSNLWSHSVTNGAGVRNNVSVANFIGCDEVAIESELPRMTAAGELSSDPSCGWMDGCLYWDVPFGWAEMDRSTGDQVVKLFATDEQQEFMMRSDGC